MANTSMEVSSESDTAPTSPGGYTFLNAKASNVPGAPVVEQESFKHDKYGHTRNKRKRTSQEDHAILETAYQQNPKPSKEQRASLASQVSLTDKETQVWFQNRRQQSRKKRNTWQRNEITSIIRSSRDGAEEASTSPSTSQDTSFESSTSKISSQESEPILSVQPAEELRTSQSTLQNDSSQDEESEENPVFSQPIKSGFAYYNKQDNSSDSSEFTPSKLKRTSSTIRLSTSLDGKASVIIRGQTPSPPVKITHSNPVSRAPMQRSKSLISASPSLAESSQDISQALLPGVSRVPGRSRDTRNWEFWCDIERREQLTKTAQFEARDSAAGPIALLRAGSSKKTENAPKKRKSEEAICGNRPKLARTKSSAARLQSDIPLKQARSDKMSVYVDEDDSNKENVDPLAHLHQPINRPTASPRVLGNKRHVLGENKNMLSHSSSLGALMAKEKTNAATPQGRNRKKLGINDQENADIDPEVAKFMSGGSDAQEEDDIDAVQNLLRLSQGHWR